MNLSISNSFVFNSIAVMNNNNKEDHMVIKMKSYEQQQQQMNGNCKLTRLVSSTSNLSSSSSSTTLSSLSSHTSACVTPPSSSSSSMLSAKAKNAGLSWNPKDMCIDPPEYSKVVKKLNEFAISEKSISDDDILSTSFDGTSDSPESQIEPSVHDIEDEDMEMEIVKHNESSSKINNNKTSHADHADTMLQIVIPHNLLLEPIKDVSFSPLRYRGPTTESNWVILDRLMMGAYPASVNDDQHYEISRRLLNCGIRTFVCLQDEYDHMATQNQWRSGKRIRPYIYDAAEILRTGDSFASERDGSKTLEMLHVAIKDCSITMDKLVQDLAEDVCLRLCRNEAIYVHCWGGHGRTGTLVAIVLGMLFGLDANEALARTQHFHDLRYSPLGVQSPQTVEQRNQVRRILNEFHVINRGKTFKDLLAERGNIVRQAPSPFTIFKMCSGKS